MPPHPGAGDAVDWDRAAEQWGGALPADYREFIDHYGAGSVNNLFHLALPLAGAAEPLGPLTFARLVEDAYYLLEPAQDGEPAANLGGRIPWALDICGCQAFWENSDPDPERWTVLVLDRHGVWTPYPCGMADFVLGSLQRRLEPALMALPLDDHPPVFRTWREIDRHRRAGTDPWAGGCPSTCS
ncbi:hypothetical protein GCM10009665_50980 [Kitasatospora nipponensis]|uniref:SMI1/KNR4 family protein SUKH-1 n=2 Tax=Kitasatospora nipponensis TaxID=258049 RepID=A0ABN1WLM5_9ACTN